MSTWVTRAGVHIDRAASAWLIRRAIDPDARFVFVDDPDERPADAVPFDIRGVELGHQGQDCTFETLLRRHDLLDPVLWRIAAVVHEADLEDDRDILSGSLEPLALSKRVERLVATNGGRPGLDAQTERIEPWCSAQLQAEDRCAQLD